MIVGLPAELPKFWCKRQLGDVSARSIQDADDDNGRVRSAADASDATHSANDSSMLDMDMDETG